jgi:hypothetical protein
MLVSIQGFGSIWEQRIGKDPSDPWRYSRRSAFYNTTGIFVNGTYRYRWVVGGKVRFEGGSWFDSTTLHHNLDQVFECDEPEERSGWVQMCCARRLPKPQPPDWFLFAVRSDQIGWMRICDRNIRSDATYLLSYSAQDRQQEVMLLMKRGTWISGERGCLVVQPHPRHPWSARLHLEERD